MALEPRATSERMLLDRLEGAPKPSESGSTRGGRRSSGVLASDRSAIEDFKSNLSNTSRKSGVRSGSCCLPVLRLAREILTKNGSWIWRAASSLTLGGAGLERDLERQSGPNLTHRHTFLALGVPPDHRQGCPVHCRYEVAVGPQGRQPTSEKRKLLPQPSCVGHPRRHRPMVYSIPTYNLHAALWAPPVAAVPPDA